MAVPLLKVLIHSARTHSAVPVCYVTVLSCHNYHGTTVPDVCCGWYATLFNTFPFFMESLFTCFAQLIQLYC